MSGRAETFVVVNHSAARARAAWAIARRALEGAGVAFEAHEAREFGDARAAAREALRAGLRTIAVVGGDGTLSEVVNGFFQDESAAVGPSGEGAERLSDEGRVLTAVNPETALAILPAGTGNDFARSLEGRRASLAHWIERLIAHCLHPCDEAAAHGCGTTRAVDVLHGTVGDRARTFLCLNAVTLGIGAEVAARVAAQGGAWRRLSGEARFAMAALAALARWRERRVRIKLDEHEDLELETNLVAVANSPFAGGGMMFAPGARLDDGLLDVVTARTLSRAALLRELTRVHTGGHLKNPRVRVERAARIRIKPCTPGDALPVEADGDVRGSTPLELRVMPRALRVVY